MAVMIDDYQTPPVKVSRVLVTYGEQSWWTVEVNGIILSVDEAKRVRNRLNAVISQIEKLERAASPRSQEVCQ